MLIKGLDLFCGGQLVTRLGFQNVGARPFPLAKHVLVLLKLLLVGFFLGLSDVDLILRKQGLGVIRQHPHQQFLAFAAKDLVCKQRLGYALSVIGIRLVVNQRLLHHKGRAVTVVVAVIVGVAALVEIGGLGVVAPLVVVVGQLGQQPGAANDPAFKARVALLDCTEELRIIAQRLFVHLKQPHCLCTGRDPEPQRKREAQPGSSFHRSQHPNAQSAQNLRDPAAV